MKKKKRPYFGVSINGTMLPNRHNLGETSKHYPLVRDKKGEIIIAGTRYTSKRQHYPV